MVHDHSDGDRVVLVQSKSSLNTLLHLMTSVNNDHWISGPCLTATSETHCVASILEITQPRRLWEF